MTYDGAMADTVQQIKDKLSIHDVVSSYVKLDRAGNSWRARCPFHAERTPSFHVSVDRGTYHCFGCGVGGDIFSFVEAIEGVDFKGALKILAERAGVKLEYGGRKENRDANDRLFELLETATIYYSSLMDSSVHAYLKKRGLSEATTKAFRVGSAGNEWSAASDFFRKKGFSEREIVDAGLARKSEKGGLIDKFRNRIMFPISDNAGRVVGFSGRSFGEQASPDAPKYLNSPETPLYHKSKILYGFDRAKQAIRKHNFAVLVEGQMDLLASHQAGFSNTVAVSGTALTPEHSTLLKRMTENLVIALDADEAGIKAAGRAARAALASGLNVKVAALPDGLDPADLILEKGIAAWKEVIREAKDIIVFLLDVLEKHAGMQDKFRRAVETIVLPFLADVQSPIAREQHLRLIAQRLGVSESAVSEALKRLPREAGHPGSEGARPTTKPKPEKFTERTRNAFALLIWQETQSKPVLDVAKFARELSKAIGKETFELLRELPATELEKLRFSAEKLFSARDSLEREEKALLLSLTRERITNELAEATGRLKQAEAAGDEDVVHELMQKCKKLTAELAAI